MWRSCNTSDKLRGVEFIMERFPMLRMIVACFTCLVLPMAASADQDLVRLPGQGELKPDAAAYASDIGRLIPGGGLLLSFDTNRDGRITDAEISTGIEAAFIFADANADGRMTPLEQIKWTETLPTRDASLANPARFDPNLDRVVRNEEFNEIVHAFAARYKDETIGAIPVEALKSKQRGRLAPEEPEAAPARRDIAEEDAPERTRRSPGRGS